MSPSKEATPQVEDFIEQWFNHLNIQYSKNIVIPNVRGTINYYLPTQNLAILIPNWKRPIAVSVINTAVIAYNVLNLKQVIIVASQVSEYATETIQRLNYPIRIIEEYSLTDLLNYVMHSKQTIAEQIV